jgi:hypothetical protein
VQQKLQFLNKLRSEMKHSPNLFLHQRQLRKVRHDLLERGVEKSIKVFSVMCKQLLLSIQTQRR